MKIISKPAQISDRQRGFTLLEVLIAVMLLAVGLLGLAGLQAVSLRNNHSAYLRSQATMLAYEIIDSMRTNRSAVRSPLPGSYQDGSYEIPLGDSGSTSPPDCMTAPCSGPELATFEITDWKQRLGSTLPSGDGSIAPGPALPPPEPNVVTVTIRWTDGRGAAADATKIFTMSTEL